MKSKRLLICTFILLASLVSAYASERQEQVFKVSGPASISLSNIAGGITVETGGISEIRMLAEKRSPDTEISVQQVGDRIRITSKDEVSFHITTPQNTDLDLHSVSGDIHVSGVSGKVEAITVSGKLHLAGLGKHVTAKTVSGNVTLQDCQSDSIFVKSVSGDLTLTGVSGSVEGKSVSGNVRFTKAICSRLDIVTTNGDIIYQGQLTKNGSYTLHAHSGNISIVLPVESSFEVGAKSFSGSFDSDFPLKPLAGKASKDPGRTSLRATYGSGEAVLELKTFSGNIKIKKQ